MRWRSLATVGCACIVHMKTLSPAWGAAPSPESSSAKADYRALSEEGATEFNRGNFQEALALFRKASSLTSSARTTRAIAKCLFELKHYTQAIHALDEALAAIDLPLPADLADDARTLRKRALDFTAVVTVVADPANLAIEVDGLPFQSGDRLDVGPHTVAASREGYVAFHERIEVVADATPTRSANSLRVVLARQSVGPTTIFVHDSATRAPQRVNPGFGWLGLGFVGVGLSVAGLVYYMDRNQNVGRCETAIAQQAYCGNLATLQTQRTLAVVSIGLGAATAVASSILFGLSLRVPLPEHATRAQMRLHVSPTIAQGRDAGSRGAGSWGAGPTVAGATVTLAGAF